MENWIPVSQALPQDEEWIQVMTQDGTVYPAVYKAKSKIWSPVFRGGEVAQLYHGNVKYWQPHAEGYKMVACPDCGRQYLKSPNANSCPICTAFKGALKEEPATEEIEKPVRRGGRQKKEE